MYPSETISDENSFIHTHAFPSYVKHKIKYSKEYWRSEQRWIPEKNKEIFQNIFFCVLQKTVIWVWMNEWMMHLRILLGIVVHPKCFTIKWGGGGLSSTTTSVQHPHGVAPLHFTRSAMGSFMTIESQDLGLTPHPKDVLVNSIVSLSLYWGIRTHTDHRVSRPGGLPSRYWPVEVCYPTRTCGSRNTFGFRVNV